MRIPRITRTSSAGIAIAATLALAPAVAAQDEVPEPSCALISADEVSTIVGASLPLNDNSAGYYCSLGGESELTISLLPETELEVMKADFSGGGRDLTVAGQPAWWQDSSGNFLVAANGSVLFLNGWGIAQTDEDKVARLTAIAELIVPRVPRPANPLVAARLTTLMPTRIGDEAIDVSVIPGWYLLGRREAIRPEAEAVLDLLGAQGRSTDELVIVAGTTPSGSSAIMAAVPDFDASALLGPLMGALVPGAAAAPTATVELGGKRLTRIDAEPVLHAYATGDLVTFAMGPEAFLSSFFERLP